MESKEPTSVLGGDVAPEGTACEKHPERPAAVVLYYPTRYACAECYRMTFDD